MKVLMIPAWSRISENPYTGILADAVESDERVAEVTDVKLKEFLRRHDVVHIHWPEHALAKPNALVSSLRALALLTLLAFARIRGAVIVWTIHNDHPHRLPHPALWPPMRRSMNFLVSRVLIFGERPEWLPAKIASDETSHPAYSLEHTGEPNQPPSQGAPTLLSFGHQRPNRDTTGLIEKFASTSGTHPEWRFLLTGRPTDNMAARIDQALSSAHDERISANLCHLPSTDLAAIVRDADVVMLPVHSGNASGSTLFALSVGTPVAATASPALRQLQSQVGEDWLFLLEKELSLTQVTEVLAWSALERSQLPNLPSALDVGRETVDSYEKALNK